MGMTAQEAAQSLIEGQIQFLRKAYPRGQLIWSNRWRYVCFQLDGSVRIRSVFAKRQSLIVSGPAGSLDVAIASGCSPEDDSDKFKPSQMLAWADRLIAAACGSLVIVRHRKRSVTSVDRLGTLRIWSHRHGQYVAVSKPGFLPELADDFIAPAGLGDCFDGETGAFNFFK